MSKLSAVPVGVLTVAGFLGIAREACPESIDTLQDEIRALPSLLEQMSAEQKRGEKLEWQHRVVAGRMAGRQRIVQEYLDGRLDLARAIERFDALNHSPVFWSAAGYPIGAATITQEQLSHQVTAWILHELQERDPQRVASMKALLEAEFQRLSEGSRMSNSH
jgi:hypothetical protein